MTVEFLYGELIVKKRKKKRKKIMSTFRDIEEKGPWRGHLEF